ncbi:hypothetical protein Tco_1171066, partial [Tanacetum coccineum]
FLASDDARVVDSGKAFTSSLRKPAFVCIAVDMSRETWLCRKDTIGVQTESYEDAWPEMKQHKFFNNVTADHPGDIMASSPPQGRLFPGKLKSRWYGPFTVRKDMKNGAIEIYDEEGSEFIVNKQRVKPYQKNLLDTNKDDDVTLDDEGEVTLYLMRRSLEVLRKFH